MPDATIPRIGDRIYAINNLLDVPGVTVTTARFWPENFRDSGRHPLLVAVHGTFSIAPDLPLQEWGGDRTWNLYLIVEAWLAGVPSESAQKAAEALTEPIHQLYRTRPLLRLNDNGLDGVIGAEMGEDTGLIPFPGVPELCLVRFPLTVTTRATVDIVYP